MPVTLNLLNFPNLNVKERSYLTADLPAGSTSIPLANNNQMVQNDIILLGNATETSELRTIASLTGSTAVVTDATTINHANNGTVLILYGSRLKVYRAPNTSGLQPTDDQFTNYVTVNIDPDQQETIYTDAAGSDAFWYKYTFYNSYSNAETALSDSAAVRGGGLSNYVTVEAIRQEAGLSNNTRISNALVDSKRQFAQAEINGALAGVYPVPFTAPVNPLISSIALQLAAGYLLLDQFGAYNTSDTNNGQVRLDRARKQLNDLKTGQLVLTDATGASTQIVTANSGGFSGYPNNDWQDGGFMFTRQSINGYNEREY